MRNIIFHPLILTCLLLAGASCRVLDESAPESPHEFLIVEAEARVTDYLPQYMMIRVDMPLAIDETQRFYLSAGVAE